VVSHYVGLHFCSFWIPALRVCSLCICYEMFAICIHDVCGFAHMRGCVLVVCMYPVSQFAGLQFADPQFACLHVCWFGVCASAVCVLVGSRLPSLCACGFPVCGHVPYSLSVCAFTVCGSAGLLFACLPHCASNVCMLTCLQVSGLHTCGSKFVDFHINSRPVCCFAVCMFVGYLFPHLLVCAFPVCAPAVCGFPVSGQRFTYLRHCCFAFCVLPVCWFVALQFPAL